MPFKNISHDQPQGELGRYNQKYWVGVCSPLHKTLFFTLFKTKFCDFPYPIYDLTKHLIPYLRPRACFSKVPRTFQVWKAGCQTVIHLFWKADLFTCFYCKKNQEDWEVWRLRTSALRRYKGNYGTQNRPKKFRDFWETGPWDHC